MHQPRVVADEQRAASEDRCRGQQIDLANKVDQPWRWDRGEQRFGLSVLVRGGHDRDVGPRQRAIWSGQPDSELGEAFGSPLLAAPVSRRADR